MDIFISNGFTWRTRTYLHSAIHGDSTRRPTHTRALL